MTTRDYSCDKCEATYKEKASLTRHIKRTHDINYVTCDQCENKFTNKDCLLSHIRIVHTEKKNYECEICEKKFKTAQLAKNHKNTVHVTTRAFACDQCDKSFNNKDTLILHVKNHTKKNKAIHQRKKINRYRRKLNWQQVN